MNYHLVKKDWITSRRVLIHLTIFSHQHHPQGILIHRQTWFLLSGEIIWTIFQPLFIKPLLNQLINNNRFLLLITLCKTRKKKFQGKKAPKINSFFPSKRQTSINENQPQQPRQQTDTSHEVENVVLCCCNLPAAINRVSCTAKQIQNRGREYYWCQRKAVMLVGMDADILSAEDFAIYDQKCKLF